MARYQHSLTRAIRYSSVPLYSPWKRLDADDDDRPSLSPSYDGSSIIDTSFSSYSDSSSSDSSSSSGSDTFSGGGVEFGGGGSSGDW